MSIDAKLDVLLENQTALHHQFKAVQSNIRSMQQMVQAESWFADTPAVVPVRSVAAVPSSSDTLYDEAFAGANDSYLDTWNRSKDVLYETVEIGPTIADRTCESIHRHCCKKKQVDTVDRFVDDCVVDAPHTVGLKWRIFGTRKPSGGGRELTNAQLSSKLAESTVLTTAEKSQFGLQDVRADDYVKSGAYYFQPLANSMAVVNRDGTERVFEDKAALKTYYHDAFDPAYKLSQPSITCDRTLDGRTGETWRPRDEMCNHADFKSQCNHTWDACYAAP